MIRFRTNFATFVQQIPVKPFNRINTALLLIRDKKNQLRTIIFNQPTSKNKLETFYLPNMFECLSRKKEGGIFGDGNWKQWAHTLEIKAIKSITMPHTHTPCNGLSLLNAENQGFPADCKLKAESLRKWIHGERKKQCGECAAP